MRIIPTMEQNYQQTKTKRGGVLIIFEGFTYTKDKTCDEFERFRRSDRSCKASGKLYTNRFEKGEKEHNHEVEREKIERKLTTEQFKEAMKNSPTRPLKSLYKETTNKLKDSLQEERNSKSLPVFSSVKSIMARERKNTRPTLPLSRTELKIPPNWRLFKGEEFVVGEDMTEDRILMFSTKKFIELFNEADAIYLDGTFFTCPDIYKQL